MVPGDGFVSSLGETWANVVIGSHKVWRRHTAHVQHQLLSLPGNVRDTWELA